MVIQPFNIVGIGEQNLSGEAISDLLRLDLYEIKELWNSNLIPIPGSARTTNEQSSEAPVPETFFHPAIEEKDSLIQSISGLGNVGIGGISFSLGNILLSMKDLSGKNRVSILTGSFQKYNTSLNLVVNLEDRHSQEKELIVWEANAKNNRSIDDQIPILVKELAFKVYYGTARLWARSKGDYPRTWQAFRYMTLGLDAYSNYTATNNISDLNASRDMVMTANRFEPGYIGVSPLLYNLGLAYMERGNYTESRNIFRNISRIDPFDSAIGLGLVYGNQGNYSTAQIKFNEAIKLKPNSYTAWDNEGWALDNLGNYNRSIGAFEESIEINSKRAYPRNAKGWVLCEEGMYDKAIECINEAIAINKDYSSAWNNKGVALSRSGKYGEAIQAYDQAIRIDPDNANVWNNEGLALNRSGRSDEAIQAYNKAIELDPKYASAWNNEGLVLRAIGNEKRADVAFSEAKKIVLSGPDSKPRIIDHAIAGMVSNQFGINRSNMFYSDDSRVYSWVKFGMITDPHRLNWTWYSPEGRPYFNDNHTIKKPSGAISSSYSDKSSIHIAGRKAAKLPGNWHVDISLDGHIILTEQFALLPSKATPKDN